VRHYSLHGGGKIEQEREEISAGVSRVFAAPSLAKFLPNKSELHLCSLLVNASAPSNPDPTLHLLRVPLDELEAL
jgi:hypothetical protein